MIFREGYNRNLGYTLARDVFGAGIATWFVVGLITFLIATIVVNSSGRNETDHFGPVPKGVIHLDADSYVIQDRNISPNQICLGGDSNGQNIERIENISSLNGTYVECYSDQSWNSTAPVSPSFLGAAEWVAKAFHWQLIFSGTLGLVLILTFVQWLGSGPQERAKRKDYKLAWNEKMELLKTQWAQGKIDDLEFDNKHTELMKSAP